MSKGNGPVDFLVSYAAEDRDWAEWIGSHLGALGYTFALQDPPIRPGADPYGAAEEATGAGNNVIVVLSLAFVEALLTSGAVPSGRLSGPGRTVAVQIEALQPPPDLRSVPTARMQDAADDYAASRDLLVEAIRTVLPRPLALTGERRSRRVPLPAPTALAEAYPIAAPPPASLVEAEPEPELVPEPVPLAESEPEPEPEPTVPLQPDALAEADVVAPPVLDLREGAGLLDTTAPEGDAANGSHGGGRSVGLFGAAARSAGGHELPPPPDAPAAPAAAADELIIDLGEPALAPAPAPAAPSAVSDDRLDSMLASLRALSPATADDNPREAAVETPSSEADQNEADQSESTAPPASGAPEPAPAAIDLTEVGADAEPATSVIDLVSAEVAPAWSPPSRPAGVEPIQHLPHPRSVFFWDRAEQLAALAEGLPSGGLPSAVGVGLSNGHGPRGDGPSLFAATSTTSAATASPTLSAVEVTALVGAPGQGKTTLATEHALRNAERLTISWWVRAANRASVVADLAALARRVGLTEGDSTAAAHAVLGWLAACEESWLLIFDGVTRWDQIADLVPTQGRGQVLVTTSNRALGHGGPVVELSGFDQRSATSFLLARSSRADGVGASSVARRLGGSPTPLELAGSFLTATGVTFDEYLAAVDDPTSPPDLATTRPVATVESCVLTSLRAAGELSPTAAAAVAALAAATADGPIPQGLVAALGDAQSLPVVDVLTSFGLATADGQQVVIPSAVRQALAYLVPRGSLGSTVERLTSELARRLMGADPALTDLLAPHALALTGGSEPVPQSRELADLASRAASWAELQGAPAEAVAPAERALGLYETLLGPLDPTTHASRRQLANLYVEVGDVDRALAAQAQVLADCEAAFGPADARTVHAGANLAANFAAVGRHEDAIRLGEQAVERLERLYGAGHPETLAAAASLAESRAALGDRPDEAPPAPPSSGATSPVADSSEGGPAALPDWPPLLSAPAAPITAAPIPAAPIPAAPMPADDAALAQGAEPATPAASPASIAGTTSGVAGHDEIVALTTNLAEIERTEGAASLDAIAARHQLAIAYGDAGDHATSASLLNSVLVDCELMLGNDHPDTLTARANLANAYAEAGKYGQSIELQERVVADHERLLGRDDPLTLTARNSLANSYASAGLHPRALEVQQQVVVDYERTHGPAHPNTLTAQHNLANSYADLGQHEQALQLRLQVLAQREAVLGIDHPQTLGARNNLANSYADLGRHEQALALRSQVLEQRERILGPDHPHTLTARNNLANSYAALGRHADALILRERALMDCERVLGPDHPHTLTARNNLANTCAALGDDARAYELRSQVLAQRGAEMAPPPPPPVPQAAPSATRNGVGLATSGRPEAGDQAGSNGRDEQRSGRGKKTKDGRRRRFWFWTR